MQQNKINILSTRPLNNILVSAAHASGIDIDEISFIETTPVQTFAVEQEIKRVLLSPATVVFTSMNAVVTVAGYQLQQNPRWNIYCMGTTTKKLVQDYFGKKSIAGTANNATELAGLIAKEKSLQKVIFFCGDQRRDELPTILRQHHIQVNEITVYNTMAVPNKITQLYNGILFFSPSAVASFFALNTISEQTTLFAIGKTTAREIKKYSNNNIIISDEPGKENLAKKMMEYFGE